VLQASSDAPAPRPAERPLGAADHAEGDPLASRRGAGHGKDDIADTGPGIDAKTLSRVFDPYFSTKAPGRGLGLSAVLGIVRGHAGAIRLRSELGVGTSFRIWIPAA
jgi:nitrogen-specific signal transduction histidine kinase